MRLTDKNTTFAEKETLEMFREEREHWQEFTVRMGRIENKLKKLEDLEEELGCPLEVYVKATIDGIIVDDEWFSVKIHKDNNGYYFALSNGSCFPFYLTLYKKTWWLRKDKSE